MNFNLTKKQELQIVIGAVGAVILIVTGVCIIHNNKSKKEENTKSEIKEYREMIDDSMDIKKAILIFFSTRDECMEFITTHGNASNPTELGQGIVPVMTKDKNGKQYYNVVGNEKLESVFDSLKDGEYSKEAIEMSGVYAYLKRIESYSPLTDEYIMNVIKEEKEAKKNAKNN